MEVQNRIARIMEQCTPLDKTGTHIGTWKNCVHLVVLVCMAAGRRGRRWRAVADLYVVRGRAGIDEEGAEGIRDET
jgi:hypothetical protein